MPVARVDDFSEMKAQIREVHRILVGNGAIGLCEQVRANTRELASVMKTVSSLADSVQKVSDHQTEHREWHAKPENMTIQQALARPGIRFILALVVVSLIVIAASMGIPKVTEFVQGLL